MVKVKQVVQTDVGCVLQHRKIYTGLQGEVILLTTSWYGEQSSIHLHVDLQNFNVVVSKH